MMTIYDCLSSVIDHLDLHAILHLRFSQNHIAHIFLVPQNLANYLSRLQLFAGGRFHLHTGQRSSDFPKAVSIGKPFKNMKYNNRL